MSGERMLRVNDADLCVDTFGDPADPAILLVMGAAASMEHWPEGFCRRLAAGGRYVIRYDHRDTGRSTSYQPGQPTYTFTDLVADAAGILDALGIERAHVAGVSMGGAMVQTLALRHPERLASLTLMSTTAIESTGRELPGMSDELRATFETPPPEPDWTDRVAVVDYLVETELPYLGTVRTDDRELRERAGRIFDRTGNLAAAQNHWILAEGDSVPGKLADLTVPTLVLHGTEDPLFPYEHGEALADVIPGAQFVALDGIGHEAPPEPVWDVAVPAILRHTAADPE